jgi:RNA polymerase sigma factor, sigma-70 family
VGFGPKRRSVTNGLPIRFLMLEGELRIIEEAKQGNTGSFGLLYEHYISPIYRFIYMKVNGREEAEDLTHEVFLSAWQNLYRYKSQGFPFSSWLYQIARNRVIDHYRVRKNHTNIETVDAEFVSISSGLEERLDGDLNLQKIKGALKALSPDQQDVLIMKFVEDLSHTEIAAALKKSEGAVRLIQHRAIKALKRIVTQHDAEPETA